VETDIGRAVKHLCQQQPAAGPKAAAATSDAPIEVLDDAVEKTAVPPAAQELKKSNVCHLNMNLQVTHTLLCENKECAYSRDRRVMFRDLSLSVSTPASAPYRANHAKTRDRIMQIIAHDAIMQIRATHCTLQRPTLGHTT